MNMVEKVARAIGKSLDDTPWQECGQGFKEICTEAARAAIEAMKEPTESMKAAVAEGSYTTFCNGGDDGSFDYFSAENAHDVWRDMITAALSEESTS